LCVTGRPDPRPGALGGVDQAVRRAARAPRGKGRFRWTESITIMAPPP